MLVLSRQVDEAIIIGDDIEVVVVDVRGDKVRLGIRAPNHVPVHRKEVHEAIQAENIAAAEEARRTDDVAGLDEAGRLLSGDDDDDDETTEEGPDASGPDSDQQGRTD